MTVSMELAKFVTGTGYSDIPQKTAEYAKELLLSDLAAMIWASTLPAGKIVAKLVKEMGGVSESGVLGAGFKTSAANAALANGNYAHTAEWEGDSRPESVGIMTVFPVVLAIGEKLGLPGKDVLGAAVVAHEVQSRIGLACLPATARGSFSVPVFGTFGAAVAAAKLMDMNETQITTALSIAASQAAGTIRQHSTMTHFVETGFACRNGIVAAMLANEGFTADTDIFEDNDYGTGFCAAVTWNEARIEKLTEGLGKVFRTELIDTKHYPCHSQMQRILEATQYLMDKYTISYDDIDNVIVEMNEGIAHEINLPEPPDGEHTRVSAQHGVAGMILEKKAGRDVFTEEKRVDPGYQKARKKVKVVIRSDWPNDWPDGYETVTIKLNDGTEHSTKWDVYLGYNKTPMGKQGVVDKFKDGADDILTSAEIERVIELTLGLETLPNVSEITQILTFPKR